MQLLHFPPERASLLAKGVAFSVVMVPVQIFAGQTGLDLHATKQGASPHPQKRRRWIGIRGRTVEVFEAAQDRHAMALHRQSRGHDDLHTAKHGFDFHFNDAVGKKRIAQIHQHAAKHRPDFESAGQRPRSRELAATENGGDFLMLRDIARVGQGLRMNFPIGLRQIVHQLIYGRDGIPLMRQAQAAFEFFYVEAIVSEGVGQTGDDLFAFRDQARGRKGSARRVGHGGHHSANRGPSRSPIHLRREGRADGGHSCLSPEPMYHPVMVSIPIVFSQRFPFQAKAVFRWATDYQPNDFQLMGCRGKRKIAALPGNAFILTDTILKTDGTKVTKKKLVRTFPDRLTWTNTHVSGPNRYSQVLYQLVAEGPNRSRLDYMGQHVEGRTLAGRELQVLAARVKRDDIAIWKNLARAMGKDLRARQRR